MPGKLNILFLSSHISNKQENFSARTLDQIPSQEFARDSNEHLFGSTFVDSNSHFQLSVPIMVS